MRSRRRRGGAERAAERGGAQRWGCRGGAGEAAHLEHAELGRARRLRDAEVALAHRHKRPPLPGVAHDLDRLQCDRLATLHWLRVALELGEQTPRRRLLTWYGRAEGWLRLGVGGESTRGGVVHSCQPRCECTAERTVARHAIAGAGGGGSDEEAPEALQLRAQLIRLRRARALRLPPTCFLLKSLRRRIGHGQCEKQKVCKEVRGAMSWGSGALGR